jgi:hypothetical protein
MARKAKVQFRQPSASAIEDIWQRRATAAAIAGAREVVSGELIPPATPIHRLGDHEWGFIVAAVIFGWIQVRAQQASAEGHDAERSIRDTGIDPDPWDAGPVIAILPELADECSDLDWNLPLDHWPKEMIAGFLLTAMRLIGPAMRARDLTALVINEPADEPATINDLNDDFPEAL